MTNNQEANANAANAASWRYLKRVAELRVRERVAVEIWHFSEEEDLSRSRWMCLETNSYYKKLQRATSQNTRLVWRTRQQTTRSGVKSSSDRPQLNVSSARRYYRRGGLVTSSGSLRLNERPGGSRDTSHPEWWKILKMATSVSIIIFCLMNSY